MWENLLPALLAGAVQVQALALEHGPFVGHVEEDRATVWARLNYPLDGAMVMLVMESPTSRRMSPARTKPGDPQCVEWTIPLPHPGRTYGYSIIEMPDRVLAAGTGYRIKAAPRAGAPARVTIAFGSCTAEDEGTGQVWNEIDAQNPDAVVLLGDAPYINSTDLVVQQSRYRAFASVIPMWKVLRRTSFYAVWDDHDFGANDADGTLAGKEQARQAFIQYHANPGYGDGTHGVYTKFRRGPVEVFLLDTRYFADVGPSPVAADRLTLLGASQWEWLTRELRASTAPVKVLASGIVWNGAVRPFKRDHWENWAHEREALLRFIGDNGIGGVVLVSGDLHRSRVIRHDTSESAGYDLTELITSPMHGNVFAWAEVPHPGLVWDAGEPHSFMLLTVDATGPSPTLEASFINGAGETLHVEHIDPRALRIPGAEAPAPGPIPTETGEPQGPPARADPAAPPDAP
jgi:alkaline phosphatase D